MEPQNLQPVTTQSPQPVPDRHMAPASLLAGIMSRVEPLDGYLDSAVPQQDCLQAIQDERWEVRAMALHALGDLRNPLQAPEPFIAALHDEHTAVRVVAVQGLGSLGEHVPLDQLILALQDRDWEVREMVVLVLQVLLLPAGRPLVQAALQDMHGTVRETARETLAVYAASDEARSIRPASSFVPVFQPLIVGVKSGTTLFSWRAIRHSWLVMLRQLQVMQKNWPLTALILGISYALMLAISLPLDRSQGHSGTALLLTLMSMLASTVSTAFTADLRRDTGLEIALSTPTSVRTILLSRFLVVSGSNLLLSGVASTAIALLYHQGLWNIVQLWLGPVLLVSALTLVLALLIGAGLSLLSMLLFAIAQLIRSENTQLLLHFLLQTNLPVFLIVLLCLGFALIYAPRRAGYVQQIHEL